MMSSKKPSPPKLSEAGLFSESEFTKLQHRGEQFFDRALDSLMLVRSINNTIEDTGIKSCLHEKAAVKSLLRDVGKNFIAAKRCGINDAENLIAYVREQLKSYPSVTGYHKAVIVLRAIDDYIEMKEALAPSTPTLFTRK